MALLKRIWFFLLTNIAVLALFAVVMAILQLFFPDIKNMGGGYGGMLIYAAIFGFLGSFFSLWISRWMAKKTYNIELFDAAGAASNPKLNVVYSTVERIARQHNITMPEVGMYESSEPNAFATGPSKNSSLVAVSTGLLNVMDVHEIEGVIGHEMAHILNGDMVTLTLIQGVMNTFVIFLSNVIARAIDSFLSRDWDSGLGWLAYNAVYIVLQIVFGFLASIVINYFSRHREYRADLGWAQYTSKKSMIAWLKKLQTITAHMNPQAQTEEDKKMAAFMITDPAAEKDSIFSTHPALTNRIKALEENYKLA